MVRGEPIEEGTFPTWRDSPPRINADDEPELPRDGEQPGHALDTSWDVRPLKFQ
jgi:hypothetical protein